MKETFKIIIKQAVEIVKLKETVEEQQQSLSNIHKELHGICGLLNTNILKYSRNQVKALIRISDQVKEGKND